MSKKINSFTCIKKTFELRERSRAARDMHEKVQDTKYRFLGDEDDLFYRRNFLYPDQLLS